MCSIAVLRDDLLSSSLSLRSWCRCLKIIHLLALCLGLMHPYSASTALCRQFINGDRGPRQLYISSVVNLRASETLTWSRATRHSSVTGRTLSLLSNSQNFLFRQLFFFAGVRAHAELVEVVHHALEGPTRIWCLRRLALCEIWPARSKFLGHLLLQQSLASAKHFGPHCIRRFASLCTDRRSRIPKVTAEGLNTRSAKPTTTVRRTSLSRAFTVASQFG